MNLVKNGECEINRQKLEQKFISITPYLALGRGACPVRANRHYIPDRTQLDTRWHGRVVSHVHHHIFIRQSETPQVNATSTTKYRLGEVAKWSYDSPQGLHRYVDISITTRDEDDKVFERAETITLPEDDAIALCLTMTAHPRQVLAGLEATVAGVSSDDKFSHWNAHETFMPVMRWFHTLSRRGTAWLGHNACKYMTVRIDMRTGHFVVCNGGVGVESKRAESTLILMIEEEVKRLELKEVRDAAAT